MKAIETKYKGYRFRSRLEARWAVFFDALGISWEYETEGFELSTGEYYLPDFKVTSRVGFITWYEVKPKHGDDDGKLDQLQKDFMAQFDESQCITDSFTVLHGDPFDVLGNAPYFGVCPRCGNIMKNDKRMLTLQLSAYFPSWPCDVGTESGAGEEELGCFGFPVTPHKGCVDISDDALLAHEQTIKIAAQKARSARFEHGETPC